MRGPKPFRGWNGLEEKPRGRKRKGFASGISDRYLCAVTSLLACKPGVCWPLLLPVSTSLTWFLDVVVVKGGNVNVAAFVSVTFYYSPLVSEEVRDRRNQLGGEAGEEFEPGNNWPGKVLSFLSCLPSAPNSHFVRARGARGPNWSLSGKGSLRRGSTGLLERGSLYVVVEGEGIQLRSAPPFFYKVGSMAVALEGDERFFPFSPRAQRLNVRWFSLARNTSFYEDNLYSNSVKQKLT